MHKIVLAYVPVIQKAYLKFFQRHKHAEEIYVWGKSLIDGEPKLKKEIRALDPRQAANALGCLIGRRRGKQSIQIAELDCLETIAKTAMPLVLPDDAISRALCEHVIHPLGLKAHQFDNIFLRWDHQNVGQPMEVVPDEICSRSTIVAIVEQAEQEAAKSSDWWRQVGAVLFDKNRAALGIAHNHHNPTDFTPYIDGDPRAASSKGQHIELSTATHAEACLLATAARKGIKTEELRMFVTTFPCPVCAKFIADAGIAEVWYTEGYAMVDGERVLRDAGVKIVQVK